MTANVVRVNGDYKIQTGQGGVITLDTGSSSGSVNIVGNLTVAGTMTTLNTSDLTIEDNTITLNKGEQGSGVSQNTAGIVIDRGTASRGNASIIWDETQSWDDPVSGTTQYGLFIFNTALGGLNGIRTNSINTNNGTLYINTGSSAISVHGSNNYETHVTDDNHIPNKKYVDAQIAYSIAQVGGAIQNFPPNPNVPGFLLNDGVGNLSWLYPTASTVNLGNVTNESKSTMFTNAALTGTPTAPTATATTSTTQIATTAFVQNQVTTLLDSVPDAGKTLGKLYTLIQTANSNIALNAPISNPTFTGTVGGITAAMVGLDSVTNESKATMFSSPVFTGTVSGVTAAMVGLGNVTNESKATMFSTPTFTGHPTIEGVTSTGATGTGNLVFSSSPTLTSPTLGAATASSINKVAITTPATSATLNISDGKTLNVQNTVTLSGTDNSTITFGAGGTVAYTGNNLSVFAATTSAQLAGIISDETGSGKLVFATSPSFTTSIDGDATFSAFSTPTALTIGNTTAASTTNISTAALTSGTKTINIGTGGTTTAITAINIGSSTGTTTTVYGLTATSPSIGTSIVTGNSSFDVFNTTATTINAFGAATTANIGYTGIGAASTTNISTAALTGAFTKTINIGTGGTTGSTTTINIGSSTGTTTTIYGLTLTSPSIATSIVTGNSSFDVFNTTATTINAFGAATTIGIGAATGTLTINNTTVTLSNATALNINGSNPSIVTSSTGVASVFNTNTGTGNLFGAATVIGIGASSGTITINNATVNLPNATTLNINGASPSIATSNTGTASVFNTNATTGNLFGAATTINIGGIDNISTINISGGTITAGRTRRINIGQTALTAGTNIFPGSTFITIGQGSIGTTSLYSPVINLGSTLGSLTSYTTFSASGNSVSSAGNYTVSPTTNGYGGGCLLTIVKTGSGTTYSTGIGGNLTITVSGSNFGYAIGDTITVLGTLLGGTSPANDLTLTILSGLSSSTINTYGNANVTGTVVMSSGFIRNRIINGSMMVSQRATSGVVTAGTAVPTASAGYPCVDRWFVYSTGANVTAASPASTGIQGLLSITGAASVTGVGIGQRIESLNSYDLAGSICTLSFTTANSLLTSLTYTISYATTVDTFGTIATPTKTQIATGTVNITGSLTQYSVQIAIPSAAKTGIEIVFNVGAQISGTWQIGNVQFEPGTVATPYERRQIAHDLAMCQRYYYRHTSSGSYTSFGVGVGSSSTTALINIPLPVTMRTAPAAIDNSAVTSFVSFDGNTNIAVTGLALTYAGANSASLTATSSSAGLTVGRSILLQSNSATTAYIGFSAELT
jgi:hypothetical protein